jgi:DNA-directed RNA polymerase beta subunit
MIQFKNWRQYTHVVDGVRFPPNAKQPILLIYFSENSNFINDYSKLNLRRVDFKTVMLPITTVPRTRLTPNLIKAYRSLKLIPLSLQQKTPPGQNIILDLSQYLSAIDVLYKPTNYRQRAGFLIKNTLLTTTRIFPDNFRKVFVYSIDLDVDVKSFVNKKIFPFLKEMKTDGFIFDDMILTTMQGVSSRYRYLIKDKEYLFPRVFHYVRNIKGIPTEEEQEEETVKAANLIMKTVDDEIEVGNKEKVKAAVKSYLAINPEETNKISSGDIDADEMRNITTTSILYKVSGDLEKSQRIAKNIPAPKRSLALKAIGKNLASELLQPEKTVDLSTDPRVMVFAPEKMVGSKSPNHVYKKRQVDFEINLKKDLVNSFRVLETKDVPLKFEKINIVEKPTRAGEIMKSDLNIANITLKDSFGNTHNVQIELPKIDPNSGVFRLNGRQKCLINQIVQNPITFPSPGESRFESSYSIFKIYVKTLRNVKYLEAFMSYKMPLLFLLSFSFGFKETMSLYKIKYDITDTKPKGEDFVVKIKNGQYVVFKNLNTDLQKQLCLGFIRGNPEKYEISAEFGTHKYFEDLIIKFSGRLNSTFLITSNLQNIVDPVVKQVLQNKQLPTQLNLIMKYMTEKVIQGFHISRNDINNQRIRNSEVLVHLAQKQILAAYTVYKEQVLSGNQEATFNIVPTKVLSDFLKTELVVDMEYANPIEEMSTMTRISPSGKKVGGIPDKRTIQVEARNIHDSYFGNIDPLDTSESDNVGVVQQLTIDALISSSRGLFATKPISNTEGTGMLSTTTSMVPFLENTDGARVIMLSNQAKQMLPLKNPQGPIVRSGYESILTGVLSDNFIKRSPCAGKVLSITKDTIIIQCNTGKKELIDISPVHLRSGSGKDTLSVFKVIVKNGAIVKHGQIIAEGACMSKGSIALGRPLLCALMPYKGYNFEDGIIINESVVNQGKLTSLHGVSEEVLVSDKDRLLYIAKIGETVAKGQPLLRKTIGEVEELIGFEDDETTDLTAGQFIKKSPGGHIVDIEVFSNIKDNKFPMLEELIGRTNKKYSKPPREKFTIKHETIKGVYIVFKLEQELPANVSDKLCNRYGNKGIISLVEKDELMPRLPNGERIEIILNPIGLISRMNMGQLYEMYCGMISRELGRLIPLLKDRTKIINLIKKVYGNLDISKNKITTATLVKNLSSLPATIFKQLVDEVKETGYYPIIIPPFQSPKHTDIENAMKVLGLKTAYNLTLPEYNTKTSNKVPVGYMYISKLEHMGDAKIYGRSTGPVTSKTSQPTSGKRHEGGQRLGELDTYSFIAYNCPSVLAEFMGPLSDDYITRDEMLAEIIQKGNTGYHEPKISPVKDLLNSYFISLMLVRD